MCKDDKTCSKCSNPRQGREIMCDKCLIEKNNNKFMKMELVEWDGVARIAEYKTDNYFSEKEEVIDFAKTKDIDPKSINLVLCSPNYAEQLDDSFWEASLPNGVDFEDVVTDDIIAARRALNDAIGLKKTVLSWSQENKRVSLFN